VSATDAAGQVSTADQTEQLNSLILAALANALWQSAVAEPDYAGLPYPVAVPITPAMAGQAESAMGSSAPTVGSFTGGGAVAGSASGSVVSDVPTAGTTPDTGASTPAATNPTSGGEQVDFGPDPGIGLPTLETIPTAAQILAPILGLFSDLRTWAVPSHSSECPKPSFDLWGQTYTFTAQCDLLDQYGAEITAAFEVAFGLAAVLIVLTA